MNRRDLFSAAAGLGLTAVGTMDAAATTRIDASGKRARNVLLIVASLAVPVASDVQLSPSWRAITATPGAKLGQRTLEAFLHRPSEELYELTADPDEVVNLAGDAAHAAALADLRTQLRSWRAATHDPWLAGVTDPFGHAH